MKEFKQSYEIESSDRNYYYCIHRQGSAIQS